MRKFFEKQASKIGLVGAAAVAYVENAIAAIDLTAVQTGISGAAASGETVGGYVAIAVVTLVAVGLIIGIIKKL